MSRAGALELRYPAEWVDRGLVVISVIPGSAAADAGLKVADQITSLDGVHLGDVAELRDALQTHEPGDIVELSIFRGRHKVTLSVTLRARKLFF
jgi:S1-C subfamily serine protease